MKEHKRIKEAGGFITFNGVWRVAGVLATSRALGDFPLKDRRLVVAQPDVLTFNLADLGATFMVLASDGLWDALSNDDAVAFAAPHLDEPLCGARSLVNRAYDIGSLDNISALVVDLRGVVGDSGQGDGRTHVIGE
ncbi:protein phosphatase 1L [Ixodes scapularis]